MGYECPVCGVEEADDEHLANHVAFTALVRGGDHEAWLDDHVPDWEERDPDTLAPEVVPHATETESEPTTEPHGHAHDHDVPSVERTGQADLSGAADDVLEEARELTEAMYENRQVGDSGDTDDAESAGGRGDSENE
ncbi:DUF5810 domain-containing protein [Halobacterium jilantaiense]|uniref:C2H2-type domain-containing protein n=1 Tax=Halobacterium jilantaiense TaxID=355548 RepID=A0A1I0PE59_9EURY|nr:DUF5810 domain-containing protein [Halobacterium jilantaiense]SEW12705.1 hypothetical protein SAMN04487945_1628 [Halobacterium jilantaiense]